MKNEEKEYHEAGSNMNFGSQPRQVIWLLHQSRNGWVKVLKVEETHRSIFLIDFMISNTMSELKVPVSIIERIIANFMTLENLETTTFYADW